MSDTGLLNVSAVTYHEWFESLRRAGFTESQALYLVGQSVHASVSIASMRYPHG